MYTDSKIKNAKERATTSIRRDALEILEEGLRAIDTADVLHQQIRVTYSTLSILEQVFELSSKGSLYLVGIGKCAKEAGVELEKILGERLTAGIILGTEHDSTDIFLTKCSYYMGTHPLPSDANIKASEALISFLEKTTEHDTVLFVISGGASTLLCLPQSGTCIEEREIVQELINKGATIEEINIIRKHISKARGGNLAKYAYPSHVISLIFSDVPGDDISSIASGPTVKDETTVEDTLTLLAKYKVLETCGIEDCGLLETPKEDIYFKDISNIVFVSNNTALSAMKEKAEQLGYIAEIITTQLQGEASQVGKDITTKLHEVSTKTVLLYGGETTVTVSNNNSHGGRNQELSLSALQDIREDELILSLASDGRDNGDIAGGIADIETYKKSQEQGLVLQDFLTTHTSYDFWKKVGEGIVTGATGSNVADIIIAIKK